MGLFGPREFSRQLESQDLGFGSNVKSSRNHNLRQGNDELVVADAEHCAKTRSAPISTNFEHPHLAARCCIRLLLAAP